MLPSLRDVDTWEDALIVADLAPSTAFAAAVVAASPIDLCRSDGPSLGQQPRP